MYISILTAISTQLNFSSSVMFLTISPQDFSQSDNQNQTSSLNIINLKLSECDPLAVYKGSIYLSLSIHYVKGVYLQNEFNYDADPIDVQVATNYYTDQSSFVFGEGMIEGIDLVDRTIVVALIINSSNDLVVVDEYCKEDKTDISRTDYTRDKSDYTDKTGYTRDETTKGYEEIFLITLIGVAVLGSVIGYYKLKKPIEETSDDQKKSSLSLKRQYSDKDDFKLKLQQIDKTKESLDVPNKRNTTEEKRRRK
jgi:hypothetical protein